jgi:hypothetical protein
VPVAGLNIHPIRGRPSNRQRRRAEIRTSLLPDSAIRATMVLAVLLLVAAGCGLFLHVYSAETAFARNAYRGADAVSLVVALPLLVYATLAARRGSRRGLLLWLGAVGYIAYQYGYTFAYRWNRLFLVYLVLLSLSAFTIARTLIGLDPRSVSDSFDAGTPTVGVGRFVAIVGVGLGIMELSQIIPTVFTGDVPQIVTDTGHPTSPVYILDLGLVVPLLLLSAKWLHERRSWGYVTAPIMLVKGLSVGLGLLAANLFAVVDDTKTDGPLNVLWGVIAVGSAVALWRFLRHLPTTGRSVRRSTGTKAPVFHLPHRGPRGSHH